ncbi:protein kinase domain-containing protein [Hyphomonas sp.]|uniref:protein kinase domain-containing protein n=1 Tax=Hyphomonas sp. TaxID=87 RepID=UPI00391BD000
MQWDRILNDVKHARELSPEACAAFLSTLETTTDHAGEVRRLLTRLDNSFLATSADEEAGPAELVGWPGLLIGPWRLSELLGRGGMGEVWRAKRDDGLYEQNAAVKLMQPGGSDRAARFDNERRRLARMDHPGIARILDGGLTEDGLAYIAMDFVDGQPFDQYTSALPVREKIRLLAEVCDAVHHAHTQLILHRDLKPANILVDQRGQVRLIDFGIASSLEEGESGGPLTLAYAAPEQLNGAPLSVATDVFALGLVMHTVLTGRAAQRLADAAPMVAPRTANSEDLTAILLRATRSDPTQRYLSADSLGADLRRYLAGQAVNARAGGPAYRLGKFLKRYPVANSLAAIAILALAAGLGFSLRFAADARAETQRALEALDRAQWNQAELETINSINAVYSDALLRLSGRGMDVEYVSTLLEEFLDELRLKRTDDPEAAALASFSIGRHFLSRNDYLRARTILEPWLTEAYGSERLRRFGWSLLGHAYANTGDPGLAETAFRTSYSLTDTYGRERPGAASVLAQIAKYSLDPDDHERAIAALNRIVETEPAPSRQISALNQMYQLLDTYGDDPGANETIRRVVRIIDENPTLLMQGQDTNRLNLAESEFYFRGNADAALQQIRITRQYQAEQKGESRETARALELEGLIARRQGELETAEALLREAADLHLRFGGPQSAQRLRTLAGLAMTLTDLGRHEEGKRLLDDLAIEPPSPMLTIARAYQAFKLEGPESASYIFAEDGFDMDRASRSTVLRHYLAWFRNVGALPPD